MLVSNNSKKFLFSLHKTQTNQVKVNYEWLLRSKKSLPMSSQCLQAIIDFFGDDIYDKNVYGYTEVIKGDNLYRVDNDFSSKGCLYDNIFVAWKKNKREKGSNNKHL